MMTTTSTPVVRRMQPGGWVALAGCALIIIGALGPWKKALGGMVTVGGTDNGGDGVYVIVMALLVAATVVSHYLRPAAWKAIVGVIVAALIVVVAIVDYRGLKGDVSGPLRDTITAGWGIWLVGLAGAVTVVGVVMLARRHP